MVFEKIRDTLASQFEFDPSEINRDTDIMVDLGADSLDLVELIARLEEEYNVTVTDESVYELKTVGDITEYIESIMTDSI